MSELTQIEREAKQVRDFIAELKGLTPRFNATKERAEEELQLHLAKIDEQRAKLRELIDGASVIVQRLGLDEPAEIEATHTEEELAAVMAEDVEAVVAMADSPQDDAEVEAEATEAETTDDTFQTIGEIAAEITAGIAEMADDLPATDDQSEAPEMTDEQVERTEERLAAEPVRELEMADAGAAPRRFNPFAGNPFA